ncbi:MAG: methionyl-tRNA formyltransferase [Eubacteriales bacterium]
MRIVFMGTPDFSVGALERILEAGHEVVAVVTQPDQKRGRGKELQYTPVKACALSHGIEVYQPPKVKSEDAVAKLRTYDAQLFVVVAFGQILSQEILDMPQYGCINIHASLLPKYRGAAPIQWAVIDGEPVSGVTIMQMDVGLDTGDMMIQEAIALDEKETGASLHDKLSVLGAKLVVEAIAGIEVGTITYTKQNEEETCYAKMLHKSIGEIDFSQSAVEIERLIRGLNSWPSAYTKYNGKTLKIWNAMVEEYQSQEDSGTVVEVRKNAIHVQTGSGILVIQEVQLEGKKRMEVKDFLLGNEMVVGTILGNEVKSEQ